MKLFFTMLVLGLALVAGPALAVIDTTDAVASIGEIPAAVTAIGGALVAAAAVAVGWKWLKAAVFG